MAQWLQQLDYTWFLETAIVALAALFCISVHETCHGLAAYWLGDPTAKRMGRLTLNPIRHIDPIGLLMMIIAHFGWAKPVPVDPRYFENPKARMALTALAGPVSNVLLALLAGILSAGAAFASYFVTSRVLYYVYLLLVYIEILSAGFAVFNLIPIPPLDGSKILFSVLPEEAYNTLMRYERYGFLVLILVVTSGFLDGPLEMLRSGLMAGVDWVSQGFFDLLVKLFA